MDISKLQTARQNIMDALATASADPKPSYSIGNRSISWGDYIKSLTENLQQINDTINLLDPYVIWTRHSL